MVQFTDTRIAFQSKTNSDLQKARLLFYSFNYPFLVDYGPRLAEVFMKWHFPLVKPVIKGTLFKQFCGGENIEECAGAIETLNKFNVKSILDYSVEGEETEESFDATEAEIIKTIHAAKNNPAVAFSVFKTTGIIRFALMEELNEDAKKRVLPKEKESAEWMKAKGRFENICRTAFENNVRLFVDAEESWIQETIDMLAEEMMEKYNKQTAIVYNTAQMYRHDRVAYIKNLYELSKQKGFFLGLKIVRGAYMEKERKRAADMGYPSPIQPDKNATDKDYDEAIHYCVDKETIFVCAGTHNEESSLKLGKWMADQKIPNNSPRFYFSQLLGMSDHISYNLAAEGYNVAKYLPYGPVRAVLPYLARRAKENSSVKGQVGRELSLITQELKRRKKMKE